MDRIIKKYQQLYNKAQSEVERWDSLQVTHLNNLLYWDSKRLLIQLYISSNVCTFAESEFDVLSLSSIYLHFDMGLSAPEARVFCSVQGTEYHQSNTMFSGGSTLWSSTQLARLRRKGSAEATACSGRHHGRTQRRCVRTGPLQRVLLLGLSSDEYSMISH